MPLTLLPLVLASATDALVAIRRISTFLRAEEIAVPYVVDPDAKAAYVALDLQDSQRHTMSEREWTRRKRILPHGYLDDKYGMFFDGEEENAEKFLVGEDHRALLELWDAMEGRGGEGVVYLDALPGYPSDGED